MAKQTFTTGQVLTAAQMTSLQQTAMGGGSATAKTASYVLVAADAGTVVQMNAAGATTITVNTALFAAGDTVQIQNIGAGVCTVTAGTATVSTAGSLALSQYEGGQLYFTATGASIFFDIVQSSGMTNPLTTTGDTIYSSSGTTPARLGIGSTGQVLTVAAGLPSWATPASGSLTLISTTSLTGASVTLSSIPATYKHLQLVISGVTNATADGAFRIAPNGATTSSNNTLLNGSALEARLANYLLLVGPGGGFILTRTDANNVFVLNIYNYAATTMYKNFNSVGIATLTATAGTIINTTGSYLANTAITSLVISNSGGNLSTGTVLLYGVN